MSIDYVQQNTCNSSEAVRSNLSVKSDTYGYWEDRIPEIGCYEASDLHSLTLAGKALENYTSVQRATAYHPSIHFDCATDPCVEVTLWPAQAIDVNFRSHPDSIPGELKAIRHLVDGMFFSGYHNESLSSADFTDQIKVLVSPDNYFSIEYVRGGMELQTISYTKLMDAW